MLNSNLYQLAYSIYNNALNSESSTLVSIGDISDVRGGKRLPKGVNLQTTPNNHPYIRVRDLNDAVVLHINSEFEYVDDETQKGISRYIVNTSDVLISIVGTIGLTAIVHSSLDTANLTENCVKITNLKSAFPEYILLFLRSKEGQEAIARGTVGAVQAKLPLKNIQSINIPLLSEDVMIALQEQLVPLFNRIADNTSENMKLTSLRDTLLPKLMSGEIDLSDIDI